MAISKSKGLKRILASGLIAIAGVSAFIPGLSVASDYLAQAAGVLGAVGVGHAVKAKTTYKFKLASLAAFLTAFSQALKLIPEYAVYGQYLEYLASILGGLVIGERVLK